MIKRISFKFAAQAMMVLLSCVLVYHALVLTELIPHNMAWGGRLQSKSEMYAFELISICVNLLLLLVIAVKGSYIGIHIPSGLVTVLLWAFTVIFALNTIGNLFSKNIWETIIFTPLTLISAILCFRLAIEKTTISE